MLNIMTSVKHLSPVALEAKAHRTSRLEADPSASDQSPFLEILSFGHLVSDVSL